MLIFVSNFFLFSPHPFLGNNWVTWKLSVSWSVVGSVAQDVNWLLLGKYGLVSQYITSLGTESEVLLVTRPAFGFVIEL